MPSAFKTALPKDAFQTAAPVDVPLLSVPLEILAKYEGKSGEPKNITLSRDLVEWE